jgi:hypothetical protein
VNELGERMQANLEHDSCPVRLAVLMVIPSSAAISLFALPCDVAKSSGIEDPAHHPLGLVSGEDNNLGSQD